MQRVVLSEAAAEELDAAYRWYDIQREGLAAEFLDEFLGCVKRVAANPRMHPIVEAETRRARLHRFPYSVYYRLVGTEIVIIAVFHGKRDPIHWRTRL